MTFSSVKIFPPHISKVLHLCKSKVPFIHFIFVSSNQSKLNNCYRFQPNLIQCCKQTVYSGIHGNTHHHINITILFFKFYIRLLLVISKPMMWSLLNTKVLRLRSKVQEQTHFVESTYTYEAR